MPAYMITYDLNADGQNYSDVIQAIKNSSISWCTYWKSSYLIKSNLTANEISDKITPYLDNNDRMIVFEVNQKNYQGWLTKKQWEFIKENIFD